MSPGFRFVIGLPDLSLIARSTITSRVSVLMINSWPNNVIARRQRRRFMLEPQSYRRRDLTHLCRAGNQAVLAGVDHGNQSRRIHMVKSVGRIEADFQAPLLALQIDAAREREVGHERTRSLDNVAARVAK